MKNCIIFFTLVTITIPALAQKNGSLFADSIIIYKGFNMGGTTANLHYFSHIVDTIKTVSKHLLQNEYLDSLNKEISNVKAKRHLQQKIGLSYYATVYRDNKRYQIAFVENFGIIDLTSSKQYRNNQPFQRFISRLINKNYH